MQQKDKIKPLPTAQKDLEKVLQEGNAPSVENLMMALSQSKATVNALKNQLGQLAENFRDLQIRLATTEFQHRLDFLWKVMFTEGSATMFGKDFIRQCADEFKLMMFPPIAEEEQKQE